MLSKHLFMDTNNDDIVISESSNLSFALLFPALGFSFISYMGVKDLGGNGYFSLLAASLAAAFFFKLWQAVLCSVCRTENGVELSANGSRKIISLSEVRKISVVAGPLSRSVVVVIWLQKRRLPFFRWTAFECSNVGDYKATIAAIRQILSISRP